MNTFLKIGVVGFAVILIINLLAMFTFAKPDAVFFTDKWWSIWFVNYVVWITFMMIGIGQKRLGKSAKHTSDSGGTD